MIIKTTTDMEQFGCRLGQRLQGGEVIELIGDIGVGKTTLTRGLAKGLGVTDNITSPSFTINCTYQSKGHRRLILRHYDFYRLSDPGIVALELAESLQEPDTITVIEWSDKIKAVLPVKHIVIKIEYLPTSGRQVSVTAPPDWSYLTS